MSWIINRDEWLKLYGLIKEHIPSLNYSMDQESTDILSELLSRHSGRITHVELFDKLKSRRLGVVVGCGGNIYRELALLTTIRDQLDFVTIAAGSTVRLLHDKGINPDVVVTDLDGDVNSLINASRRGAIVVIHAHGDNIEEVYKYTPLIQGSVIGSTQVEPRPFVYNFGGFTDGDRGLFILYHAGVTKAILVGFDFEKPHACPGKQLRSPELKKKKLEVAEMMINYLKSKGMVIKSIGEFLG